MQYSEEGKKRRSRLLRELQKLVGDAAVANAAPYVNASGDELDGLLVTREGGLAALDVLWRGLQVLRSTGRRIPAGFAERFESVKESWGLQWGYGMEDEICALRDNFNWDRMGKRPPKDMKDIDLAIAALGALIHVAGDVSDGEYGALEVCPECGARWLAAPE